MIRAATSVSVAPAHHDFEFCFSEVLNRGGLGGAPPGESFFGNNAMGKIFFDLYQQIWQPQNIWTAYKDAARGKRSQPTVAAFGICAGARIVIRN